MSLEDVIDELEMTVKDQHQYLSFGLSEEELAVSMK